MNKYGTITDKIAEDMNDIYTRLGNIEKIIDLFNLCIDSDAWVKSSSYLSAFTTIIQDYAKTTKNKYKIISEKLETFL